MKLLLNKIDNDLVYKHYMAPFMGVEGEVIASCWNSFKWGNGTFNANNLRLYLLQYTLKRPQHIILIIRSLKQYKKVWRKSREGGELHIHVSYAA